MFIDYIVVGISTLQVSSLLPELQAQQGKGAIMTGTLLLLPESGIKKASLSLYVLGNYPSAELLFKITIFANLKGL